MSKETANKTAKEWKKQKLHDARSIQVQTAPSGMSGLPGAIDVEKFAEARAFEINAMQNAMKSAAATPTQRAWQTLPRHLRRRAASHDVRRVPLRLRDKARAEMTSLKKKILGRSLPKLGRNRRLLQTQIFLKRQRNKQWLETHLWHAKRMNMQNMWGYRLAVKPSEKAFRPSHRASVHGSIIHDASYMSLIELKGPEDIIKDILESCCDPQGAGPGSKRYTAGTRTLSTHIYKPSSYPFDLIAPITVIWRPICFLPTETNVDDSESSEQEQPKDSAKPAEGKQNKRKRKRKEKPSIPSGNIDGSSRIVWIRCHPSVFTDVYNTLQFCASATLDASRKVSKDVELELADLRGQAIAFDIMGPKSSQVLKGALSPTGLEDRPEFKKLWQSLTDLQTSASIAPGMIVGFKVHDPRLKFPPKNAKPTPPDLEHTPPASQSFPATVLAQSEIWDEKIRARLKNPRFKKAELDTRRAKNLIPGTPLKPRRNDDRIPGLLVQRTLGGSQDLGIHGWTLILPAGWAMPFFMSLIYTGTRVGGQCECQTQAFEAGVPYFPHDYPTTVAYETYAKENAEKRKDKWRRTPPAKRVNYKKLGIRSPWRADWEVVLGFKPPPTVINEEEDSEDLVTTQREPEPEPSEPVMEVDTESIGRPWLLCGPETSKILTRLTTWSHPAALLLEEVNKLRNKCRIAPFDSSQREPVLNGALINVKVTMCCRGTPDNLAAVYCLSDGMVQSWNKALQMKAFELDDYGDNIPQEYKTLAAIPPSNQIIGYVTSGSFSLSRGQGYAVATVSLKQLLQLFFQRERLYSKDPHRLLVNVKNHSSRRCQAAYIDPLHIGMSC